MRLFVLALSLALVACSSEGSLRAACEKGDPGACDVLRARYAYGDGVKKSPERSTEYGERAGTLCADAGASSAQTCARYMASSVPLDLPKATLSGDTQVVFSVVLASNGTTQVDGRTVSGDDGILPFAKNARERYPDLRAVIQADSAVPHGRVIHALDVLKQAGISKIAFGVSPAPR